MKAVTQRLYGIKHTTVISIDHDGASIDNSRLRSKGPTMRPRASRCPNPGREEFIDLVNSASEQHVEHRQTADFALELGLHPKDIVDYVSGRLSDSDRAYVQERVAQSPWAMDKVIKLTKGKREKNSLAFCICSEEEFDPSKWGVSPTNKPLLDGVDLLNLLE